MTTNDPEESLFAALTRKLEQHGRVLGIHAAAIGHASINDDFDQGDLKNPNNEVTYRNLPPDIRVSLLNFALSLAPEVRMDEAAALDEQRESKRLKQEALKQNKLLAAQREYANALTYIEMYHSQACWKKIAQARVQCKKQTSEIVKRGGSEI